MQRDGLSVVKISFVVGWFGMAYVTLIFAIFSITYLSRTREVLPQYQNFKLYAALPDNSITLTDEVVKADARTKLIGNFFQGYTSPLVTFADQFVTVADQYKLDYRLLPAIAMQESNGGKKIIDGSYNPFGFGIYANKVLKFASFTEAIESVGKALRTNYLNEGLTTPESIMTKYTPPSLATGGTWAKGVSSFMAELE